VSYVDAILQKGEQVLRVGRLHWIVYSRALVLTVACGLFLHFAIHQKSGLQTALFVASFVSGVLAAIAVAWTWLWSWATELAITNKRVIYKRGLIWRHTVEMNMDKVETVAVVKWTPWCGPPERGS
jgi:hypothetical protein